MNLASEDAGPAPRLQRAAEIMLRFAERTGLTSARAPRRYLWTDAFAVCNFLALGRATGEERHVELALRLVDQVHHVLGRHRADSGRTGWISGLAETEGEAHPTRGGLRIGKPLPERGAAEPLDEQLEWDRDGQYFHYLTKWMHALDQATRSTGEPKFHQWACDLAQAAHRAFVVRPSPGSRARMHWKMSIDLSRPLVPSMGQHDPLDGLVTCLQLEATAAAMAAATAAAGTSGPSAQPGQSGQSLWQAVADFRAMLDPAALATTDPLGVGGLLVDAARIEQLLQGALQGAPQVARPGGPADRTALLGDLLPDLLAAALVSLPHAAARPDLRAPVGQRLAFRELGLAIGLAAVGLLDQDRAVVEELRRHAPLREAIEAVWMRPEPRRGDTWLAHEDINEVMLATALVPEGFLVLQPPARATRV